jgi:hypothetical protein
VKLGMLPVPAAARPILVVLFVQLNTSPATAPLNVTADVAAPLHTVWFETAFTVDVGFTVYVYVIGVPAQPFALGVTVIVAVTAVPPVLTAVNAGILPVPLAANPMLGALFVQL